MDILRLAWKSRFAGDVVRFIHRKYEGGRDVLCSSRSMMGLSRILKSIASRLRKE